MTDPPRVRALPARFRSLLVLQGLQVGVVGMLLVGAYSYVTTWHVEALGPRWRFALS